MVMTPAMIRDFDISGLRTYLAVVEHANMTHAANMRNLTQSAVSQQIKKLENMLQTRLLLRQQGGVVLTAAGQQFLPHARALVRANDEAFCDLLQLPTDGDVRLGVPTDVVSSLLPTVLSWFHRAHPNINVTLVSKSSNDLRNMLNLGQIDIALTTDRESDPDAVLLFRKALIWIGAINGSAHLKSPLPVAVGRRDCPFRKATSEALGQAKLPWRAVTQVGSLEPVFATLMADMAVAAFLPGTVPNGTCEVLEKLPKLPEFSLQMRAQNGGMSKSVQELWNALKAHLN